VKRREVHVYPLVGVGGGGVQRKIAEGGVLNFDQVLANVPRSARVTKGAFLAQVGTGADRLFVLRTRERNGRHEEGGLVLGVRAGYVFAPAQGQWVLEGTRVGNGPDVGLSGPYVHFMIGGGGRSTGP
jgi:hypothetical protein